MPVIPNMGDSMATPRLLRALPLNRVLPSGFIGPSRPVPGALAHLRVMKSKNAKKTLAGGPKPQVMAVVEGVLSLSELCAQLNVSTQTIYDLRSQDRGPRGFRVGRERRGRITKQGSRLVRWAAVESVKRVGPHTRIGALRDRVAERRGGNIGAVAAARQQIEYVFYALRDGHVRALQHPARDSA